MNNPRQTERAIRRRERFANREKIKKERQEKTNVEAISHQLLINRYESVNGLKILIPNK